MFPPHTRRPCQPIWGVVIRSPQIMGSIGSQPDGSGRDKGETPAPAKGVRWSAPSKNQLIGGGVAALVVLIALFFYWIRPFSLVRGPIMIFYRHPALFTIFLLFFLFGAGSTSRSR